MKRAHKKLHVSFATEKTVSGGASFPILLTQCIDVVGQVPGFEMQKMLPIGIVDRNWWPKWEQQLVDSHGVLVFTTAAYWEKLQAGAQIQEQGERRRK